MVLHQMEYFIAVCDYGGVTPAAEALALTPQALSKSIRRLEEELDAPLFFHDKKGLTLTPFGKKALAEIRHLVSEYHSTIQRLSHISAQEKGKLRLACLSRRSFPGISISLLERAITSPRLPRSFFCG